MEGFKSRIPGESSGGGGDDQHSPGSHGGASGETKDPGDSTVCFADEGNQTFLLSVCLLSINKFRNKGFLSDLANTYDLCFGVI